MKNRKSPKPRNPKTLVSKPTKMGETQRKLKKGNKIRDAVYPMPKQKGKA